MCAERSPPHSSNNMSDGGTESDSIDWTTSPSIFLVVRASNWAIAVLLKAHCLECRAYTTTGHQVLVKSAHQKLMFNAILLCHLIQAMPILRATSLSILQQGLGRLSMAPVTQDAPQSSSHLSMNLCGPGGMAILYVHQRLSPYSLGFSCIH